MYNKIMKILAFLTIADFSYCLTETLIETIQEYKFEKELNENLDQIEAENEVKKHEEEIEKKRKINLLKQAERIYQPSFYDILHNTLNHDERILSHNITISWDWVERVDIIKVRITQKQGSVFVVKEIVDCFHPEYTLDKIWNAIDTGLRERMFQGEYSHRNLEIEIGGSDGRY